MIPDVKAAMMQHSQQALLDGAHNAATLKHTSQECDPTVLVHCITVTLWHWTLQCLDTAGQHAMLQHCNTHGEHCRIECATLQHCNIVALLERRRSAGRNVATLQHSG